MAAPKSNTYRGFFNDAENSTLDIYVGYGGASDPAEAATLTSSAATFAGTVTAATGLVSTTGGLHVKAGRVTETLTAVDDNSQNMTLAAADVLAGINVHTTVTSGGTVTTDTAANLISGIPLTEDNQSVTSYYINDGDQTATFAGGTNVTVADTGSTVLTNEAAVLLWRRTSSSAVTLYIMH